MVLLAMVFARSPLFRDSSDGVPANGSSTRSPVTVDSRIKRSARGNGKGETPPFFVSATAKRHTLPKSRVVFSRYSIPCRRCRGPNLNAYHSRLEERLRPFHGVATKNLPNYLAGAALWRCWVKRSCPRISSLGLSDSVHINNHRHQSQTLCCAPGAARLAMITVEVAATRGTIGSSSFRGFRRHP
jgi:hypothetical protein